MGKKKTSIMIGTCSVDAWCSGERGRERLAPKDITGRNKDSWPPHGHQFPFHTSFSLTCTDRFISKCQWPIWYVYVFLSVFLCHPVIFSKRGSWIQVLFIHFLGTLRFCLFYGVSFDRAGRGRCKFACDIVGLREKKAGYTAIRSRTVGQEQ